MLVWSAARRYVLVARDLGDVSDLLAGGNGLVCQGLESTSTEELMALDRRLTRQEIERRRRDGQICEVWRLDGSIVHFRWLADRRTHLDYLGLDFAPQPGDILVDEVFTPVAARGRGIHREVASLSTRRASAAGYRRQIALCAWWNTPALRVTRRWGYLPVGTVTRWHISPRPRFSVTGAANLQSRVLSLDEIAGTSG